MATRSEKLTRLTISSPCQESWDGMAGEGARRHCARCDRQVFDFAGMAPRQIEARIEATGGRLCARITRSGDGRLVTLPPPAPPFYWNERRASPIAAALMTAFLGLGGTAAEAAPSVSEASTALDWAPAPNPGKEAKPAGGATRVEGTATDSEGRVLPDFTITLRDRASGKELAKLSNRDGRFSFENLNPGTYELRAELEGFETIEMSQVAVLAGRTTRLDIQAQALILEETISTAGDVIATPEPLRREFEESSLVVLGVAGASVAIDPNEPTEVETELKVTTVFKGRFAGRTVQVEHGVYDEESRFLPGALILAFLKPGDPRPGHAPTYVSVDYNFGLKVLPEPDAKAYGDRLAALVRIDRDGDAHPGALAEWLVATAEEPLTRKEATDELQGAFEAITESAGKHGLPIDFEADYLQAEYANRLAEGKPLSEAESVKFIGAFLSDGQRGRLTRALLATHDLEPADFTLYEIVASWSRDEALDWLIRWFKATEEPGDDLAQRVMERLAGDLDSPSLKALVEKANAEVAEILDIPFTDETFEADLAKLEAESANIQKELRRRFRQMLGD